MSLCVMDAHFTYQDTKAQRGLETCPALCSWVGGDAGIRASADSLDLPLKSQVPGAAAPASPGSSESQPRQTPEPRHQNLHVNKIPR